MDRIAELIASLEARGFESPYLGRLRARREATSAKGADGLDALRREILGEMAASLGRAEDRVNEALLRLEVLDKEIAELGPGVARRAKIAAFNEQRTVAEKRLWELTVQRECIGLRRHDLLAKFFPIPRAKQD